MSAEAKTSTTRTALHVDRLMARLKAAVALAADRLEQMQADRAQALRWRDERDQLRAEVEAARAKPWEKCQYHGPAHASELACPTCMRELRAERDALRSVLDGGVSHIWQGRCPDYEDPLSRDPKCQACLAIGAARASA